MESNIYVKSRKKICAITTISKTMDWFVVDSMRNIKENGYDITLICDMDKDFIERNKDFAKLIPLKMRRGIDLKNSIKCIYRLYKIFKNEKFDVIQYSTPNASLYASIASFFARVPIRIYGQWGIRYVSLNGFSKIIFKNIEKIICNISTEVRSVSNLNMEFAISEKLCHKEKIKVLGKGGTIGVDLEKYDISRKSEFKNKLRKKLFIPENSFVFGYVGRINADKGINELIMAFKNLQNKYNDIYLVMVGMIDEANPINEDLLEWAKCNKNIIMTGNIESSRICEYMALIDTLVHPTYREGFGMVLQEAMAMEVPIITTDIPGPSEVIENNISGVLVPPRNIKLLEEAMDQFKNDSSLRSKLSKLGRRRVELYFDRKIMLKNILDDINYICKSS